MLDNNGNIKIIDFGWSQYVNAYSFWESYVGD